MNILARFKNYYLRSRTFSKAIKPGFYAPFYFAARHICPRLIFSFSYKETKFYARNMDYSAIREVFFENEYDFLLPFFKKHESPMVLDIGAHIGLFALWTLDKNRNARIISIEASPETYSILEKTNAAAINRHNYIWKVFHRAAWKDNNEISFSGDGDAMSHQVSAQGTIKVRGIDFLSLLEIANQQRIDLMKVDIEGAEESFLCDGPQLLDQVDSLVIELHAKYCNAGRVRDLLVNHFSVIKELEGRTSSKAVLHCMRA